MIRKIKDIVNMEVEHTHPCKCVKIGVHKVSECEMFPKDPEAEIQFWD